jgi:hypothetical protein
MKIKETIFKALPLLLLTCSAHSANLQNEWDEHHYIRTGLGTVCQKNTDHLNCINLGLGNRFMKDEYFLDASIDMLIHPGYQVISFEVMYACCLDVLDGWYFGPSIKIGKLINEGYYDYKSIGIIQIPFAVGYTFTSNDERMSFIEAKITHTKFLTISTGVEF